MENIIEYNEFNDMHQSNYKQIGTHTLGVWYGTSTSTTVHKMHE